MDDAELQKERILYRLAATGFFITLEEKTGVPRKQLAFFTLLSFGLLLVLIFGVQSFSQIAAFCYPAYKTFKVLQKSHALEHPSQEEHDEVDDSGHDKEPNENETNENIKKQEEDKEREKHLIDQYVLWLSYWVVYGFLDIFESPIDFVFRRFKYYYLLKTGFLLWIFLEFQQTRGCVLVYKYVVGPVLRYFEDHIVLAIEKSITGTQQMVNEIIEFSMSNISPLAIASTATALLRQANKAQERQSSSEKKIK